MERQRTFATDVPSADHSKLPRFVVSRLRRDVPLVLLDLLVVVAAYLAALVLRFDGAVPKRYWHDFWLILPVIGSLHLVTNRVFSVYGQMWRYASIQEARRVVMAGLAALALVVSLGVTLGSDRHLLPLSVLLLGAVLAVMGFGAVRFQSRLFAFRRGGSGLADGLPQRVLLMGAGDAGAMVLSDIHRHPSLGLDPVGLVDDDPRKLGLRIHGVPTLGRRSDIPVLVERFDVDQVLLAIPSARSDLVRDVAALCEEVDVPLRVLPSVREIVDGRVRARDFRDLNIEDLLGRQQVETDLGAVRSIVTDHRVLITGAGGSIGSEVARQLQPLSPSCLVLVDNDETHLHDVATDLAGPVRLDLVLGDVRERSRMFEILSHHRPEVVFHAAALKHVPVLERFPREAVATNVVGTANVVDAAVASGVRRFVLVSTDKAVHPTSVMGASKRTAEEIVRSFQGSGPIMCAVRFGNVLGSRGSVIPTFLRQIEAGGPVTITDPSMTRYFMSVQEAVQLVLQASAWSTGGEVFTLEMGQQVNILSLARRVIRLSGRVPDRDIELRVIGARPGEKIVEELHGPDEDIAPTSHPGILVARPPVMPRAVLRRYLLELERLVAEGSDEELAARMTEPIRPAVLEPLERGA